MVVGVAVGVVGELERGRRLAYGFAQEAQQYARASPPPQKAPN